MEYRKLTCAEFEKRIFQESIPRIKKCLDLIESKRLWEAPNDQITSIGCSVQHVIGNARQWILSGVLGDQDLRIRTKEFESNEKIDQNDLIKLLEEMEYELSQGLDKVTEELLKKDKEIQGFKLTGFSAMIHVIEHFSYHTGQITLLTKFYTGENTGYYDQYNLDIGN